MVSNPTSSNLAEALLNVRKIEQNFLKNEFSFLDRDRNKIRANFDRHMETFLQSTRQRHEKWYRHDTYFREGLRKEKERHEKRKERNKQKLLFKISPNNTPQVYRSFFTENPVLPPVPTTATTKSTTPEPMTKVERRTHQVLQASQKLLNEFAARPRYKLVVDRRSSTALISETPPPLPITSPSSFQSPSFLVPMTTSIDCGEYDRLINESLQHEKFSDFVDHFVKFRPEFREQFGLLHEANKRQKAVEKLKEYNQTLAKTKDERYHNLLDSLTDFRSE